MRRKDFDWSDLRSDYCLSEKAKKIAMLIHTPSIFVLWILVFVFWDQLQEAGIKYDTWKFWLMGWAIMIVPYYVYKLLLKHILNALEEY